MGVGPPEPGCRVRLQTTGRCAGMNAWVVSGSGNGGARPRQVGTWKANASEPLMRRRKGMTAIETRLRIRLWDKARKGPAYGPGGGRRRSGASHIQAPVWNVGTERPDAKGEARGEEPRRVRVPMRDAGADWSVVAKKPGNAGGAKGLACPASGAVQPGRGRGCG